MKCDELKDYDIMDIEAIDDERIKASSNGEVVPSTRVYIKADVDKRIDELKDKIQMHDFFWEGCGFDKLGFNNSIQVREEFDKLKAENESEKILRKRSDDKVYELEDRVIEINNELRVTKHALWLARAERAADRARIFYFCDMETELDIEGFSYDSQKKKGHKKLAARLWRIIWLKVERKCRSKAEEYK